MYYREIRRIKLAAAICVLIILWCIVFVVDFLRVGAGTSPIFCVERKSYEDGSKELYGLFYKVNKYIDSTSNKIEYEMGFWTLKFVRPENVDIYVEPYMEPENIKIYSEM